MYFLYNIGIHLYELAVKAAAIVNPKARKWVDGRKDYFKSLPEISAEKVIWFHCASLGEFDMALPVMNLLKDRHPDVFVLVSFFSPSGMEHYQKRKHKVDFAVYLPSDTKENARRFILHFHPEKVFFVKYEFWSNYIFEAKKQNVQIFSICSLFRNDHRFFKWYGGFFRETLKNIDFFYTQNEVSSLLLGDIGITNFKTTGDTRFDRVIENKEQLEPNIRIESFLKGETAVIIGSSWPEDEEIIVRFILKNPDRKFIIAPHNVDDQHVKELQEKLAGRAVLFTDDQTGGHVLILNTIGHLASAYSYGNVAYVGGGFSGNLHNILEPAVFGLPVIFGPKFKRFPEAFQFIHLGIGYAVKDLEGFENAYSRIMAQSGELSTITINFVEKNRGASVKVLDHIEQVFGM